MAWAAPTASGSRQSPARRLDGGGGTVDHCGSGEPWKAVVVERFQQNLMRGGGGPATGVGERLRGGTGARTR
jgi:hypothetical protein